MVKWKSRIAAVAAVVVGGVMGLCVTMQRGTCWHSCSGLSLAVICLPLLEVDMGTWKWVENVPDPEYYNLTSDTKDRIRDCKIGKPRRNHYFTADELVRRYFVGVYEWVDSGQKEG